MSATTAGERLYRGLRAESLYVGTGWGVLLPETRERMERAAAALGIAGEAGGGDEEAEHERATLSYLQTCHDDLRERFAVQEAELALLREELAAERDRAGAAEATLAERMDTEEKVGANHFVRLCEVLSRLAALEARGADPLRTGRA